MHLVIDSTGLKLFGRGEWDAEKHGRARRSWRKLHIAVDATTGEIVARVHRARGHRPARVLLVVPGTIPKTSSGKIQRSRLASMIQAGELDDRLVPGAREAPRGRPPRR